MEAFFSFPTELQQRTLTFLEPHELDLLFGLGQLQPGQLPTKCSEYTRIRHLALVAKFHGKQIVLSNDPKLATISFAEIDYLLAHKLGICPSEITFAFHDFTNYEKTLAFTDVLFGRYLPVLQCFTPNISVRLILVENVPLQNTFLKSLFQPLCCAHLNVTFTIRYSPAFGKCARVRNLNELELDVALFLLANTEIAVQSLLLHLFDSTNLIKHFVADNGCFLCHGLRVLNLSFNHLTDAHLSSVQFPAGLEHLNLSNNLLQNISNSTFAYENLTSLRSLDLSNNNIMTVNLKDPASIEHEYSLRRVKLTGNILSSYSFLRQLKFFQLIDEVDLSRNLLEVLTPFPLNLKRLDITGNYFSYVPGTFKNIFPSGLEILKISYFLRSEGVDEFLFQNITDALMEESLLESLKELYVCGCSELKLN